MADYTLNILVKGDGSGATQLADQVNAVGMSLDGVGKATLALAGGGLVALGAGLTSAVNAAGEFEAGMNNFASVAGSSLAAAGFSLDDVKAKALELGAVTQFSAAQAQDAMINLAKGGVPVADIMGQATDATLALAAAGGLELGPAADIVAKQLGVWGETGITAAQVADQLAQAANASTVDVDELAMGLANVAGTAKTAGVDFGDLTQTMALIAPGFSSAADAGTSLKTMIANLQPTTTAAKATFNELGLMAFNAGKAAMAFGVDISKSSDPLEEIDAAMRQYIVNTLGIQQGTDKFAKAYDEMYAKFQYSKFYDANGAFLGMENAATLLQGAVGNLSEADKVMALQTMFGSDAIRAAAAVANAGAPGFNAMGDAMTAAGTAADQSAIKQQGFAFALDSMKGTIETIQIVIGSALLPVLTSLIGVMTESLNGVLTFAQGILSANDPLAALVTSINTVMPGFSSFVTWIQQAATSAQPLIDMLGANLTPILAAIGTVLTGAVLVALGGLVAGFVAAAAPIAALVAGLALLYAAFSSNFLGIQTIVTTVLGVVLGIVQSVGAQIVSFWTAYGAQIMAAASAAWSGLQGLISSVLQGVLSVVVAIGGQIITFWQTNGASIMATVQTTWAQLGTIISGAIQIITAIITALSGVVSTVFSTIANFISQNTASIQAVLTGAWQVIQGVITAAMGIISGVIKTVLSAIQGDWRGVWEGLKTIVTSAVSGIGSILQGLGNIVRGALGVLGGIIKSVGEGLISAATAVGNNIIDGIKKGISAGVGALKDAVKNAAQSALDAAKSLLQINSPSKVFANQVGIGIPEGIALGVNKGEHLAVRAVTNTVGSIVGTATKVAQAGANALSGTGPPASAGDMLAGLNDFVAEFLATAQSFSMKAVRGAQGFADTVGKILAVIGPAVEALGSLRTLAAPTHESVNAFGAALAYVLGEMIVTTYSFGKKSIAAAAVFAENVGKILAPISTAVDTFAKLKDLVTPTHSTVDAFRAALQYLLGEMVVATYSFGPKSIAAAAVFAESVGKIVGVIGPAVDAFAKLPDLVVPSHAAINQFGRALTLTVAMMQVVSSRFQADAVAAAAVFAESAGKILAPISAGVDGLTKLAEFGPVPGRVFNLFGVALRNAVAVLIAVGAQFRAEAVVAAAAFGEGAGKAVGMIGSAADNMTKLRDFVAPAAATFAAFGASLRTALATLIQVMQGFTAEAIAAAGKFGEGAGKAVAFIGSAVDGFTKLKDFVAPSMGAIGSFGIALHATLVILIQTMNGFTAEAIAAAGKFGEGAGKAVSFIGNAVGSFVKLKDFQNIPQEAILMFVDNLWRVFEELEQASENFTPAGYAAAKSLYEGIGESMSVIGKAVDGIAKLKDMTNIPQATVLLFVDNLWRVFEELEQASENFTPAGYAAAKSLSDGIGESMSVIGKAIDGFLKLKEFEAVPQKTILAFVDTLWRVFEELEQASENFTAAGYAAAKSLNDGIGTSMSVIGRAVESFAKLAEFTAPAPKAIGLFGQVLRAVLTELNAVAGVFSADAVAITATFATNVNTIVSQVKGALQSFASLEDAKVGGDVLKSFMVSAQNLVGQMNAYLPPNAQIIGQNTVIGLINGIVSQRSALVTAMVNTVMAAVIAARQTLGIASPSKVFEQIGQYAGAGLQGGMAAMQPAIAATSAGLGISAVRATTSALRPSGGGTTNNNQRNITVNVTVGKDAGSNPYATADAVVTEINRRLGMQGT